MSYASETNTYRTSSRELAVAGTLWCGAQAEHEYQLKDTQKCESMAQAKSIASDFSSLDVALVRVTDRTITETITHSYAS